LKKWLRYTLRLAGGLFSLLILTWLALAAYVFFKKDTLLQKARMEIKNRFGGDARVGDWDISLLRHFPSITLHLSKVSLRDSGWQQHHHDLLQAESVDISLALFRSLRAGKVRIGKISLQQGAVYFYTDTTGYTNTYLLHDRHPDRPGKRTDPADEATPPDLSLSDMKWVMERQDKHKLFDLDIRRLDCTMGKNNRVLSFDIRTDLRVNSFSFKTEKGSFIKDQPLSGHFTVQYNTASKVLVANRVALDIGGHPFVFSGRFFPSISPDPFSLTISTENIRFREATTLLTPNLQQKLDQYDIDKPLTLQVALDAGSDEDHTPQISIHTTLDKGTVLTPSGRFSNTSFKASFTNEWVHGQKREDENSGIRLLNVTGSVEDIVLRADTLTITNLKHPLLTTDLHSRFGLDRLNDLSGSQSLQFQKGSCNLNILYKGPLSENDTLAAAVRGTLDLDSASLKYLPYQFVLSNGKGRLLFKDQDLVIDHLEAMTGSSMIRVKGVAKNLVALLDRNVEDVTMDWSLSSPHLDLRDFTSLAGRPGAAAGTTPGSTNAKAGHRSPGPGNPDKGQVLLGSAFARIDRFLKEGIVHLRLEAGDLTYKNFSGAHAKADLLFSSQEIRLTKMDVEQGGGSLLLQAVLNRHDGGDNPISLESHIDRVDLPKLFAAFNDFGQQALSGRNLKGSLTADIRMTGLLTNKAEMKPNSLKGTVNFNIRGGQLLNFEPMEKIHEAVLKKRDLSEIHFAELTNQLDLDTTRLTIHRMEIQSTALTVFVEGTYDLKSGPDLSLQVPLSNLKERNPDIPPANKGNDGKTGLSVRLRARRGDDGKLKITWDPFRKALKKKQ
jgi:hypothetical protein